MTKFVITNLKDLGDWDRRRCEFATEGLNRILVSPLFKARLLSEPLTETNGLTNQQVYDCLMKADQLNPLDKVGELDISLVLYRKSWSHVVGYTFTNSLTIWVNRRYFGEPKGIASNLMHEASHQCGFTHQGRWATTVPYVLNKIVEELWEMLCDDIDDAYIKWWWS